MKDVVRKKLGLATSVSIYFLQLRDESVDLEDGMFSTKGVYPLLSFLSHQRVISRHFVLLCVIQGLLR